MGAKSSIEWLRGADGSEGASWNPIRAKNRETGKLAFHCEHVNNACKFCYAERLGFRMGGLPFKPGHLKDVDIFLDGKTLLDPLSWRKPRKIFPCSMTDLFGRWVTYEMLVQVFAVMAVAKRHIFIVLTKRPGRMKTMTNDEGFKLAVFNAALNICEGRAFTWDWPLRNVMAGTSVSNQEEADDYIPDVIASSLAFRCVSIEPMLGPIDLTSIRRTHADGFMRPLDGRFRTLEWVIVGFESGASARHGWPDHARMVRDQCVRARVAFHFKQWGQWAPAPTHMNFDEAEKFAAAERLLEKATGRFEHLSSGETMIRYRSKKDAGRTLDGRTWDEFPDMGAAA